MTKAVIENIVAEFRRKESVSPGFKDCPRISYFYLLFLSPSLKVLKKKVHIHPFLSFFVWQLPHRETNDLSLSPVNSLWGLRREKKRLSL